LKGVFVMTTNATTAEDRLVKLGIDLPKAPTPFGAYVPAVQTGNLLFLTGLKMKDEGLNALLAAVPERRVTASAL
jgi:hypothetical protein